jgi:hypothetical protein
MTRLEPPAVGEFLRRFHQGCDGRLLGIEITTGRGSLQTVAFLLRLREADDADVDIRLELAGVNEMRFQVRPTEDPTPLTDGIAIGSFGGLTFVDLMPWTDKPSGVHDYRLSNCYAAGAILRWDESGSGG